MATENERIAAIRKILAKASMSIRTRFGHPRPLLIFRILLRRVKLVRVGQRCLAPRPKTENRDRAGDPQYSPRTSVEQRRRIKAFTYYPALCSWLRFNFDYPPILWVINSKL